MCGGERVIARVSCPAVVATMFSRSQWEALAVLTFNLLVLLALGYRRSHGAGAP